jgi:hypothetical protein
MTKRQTSGGGGAPLEQARFILCAKAENDKFT